MKSNKIYFAGSIRGGRDDALFYSGIVEHLKNYGTVLTEHIGDICLSVMGEDGLTDNEIHDRDVSWLDESNIIVAEVTKASLGVGYEIGRMIERNLWVPEDEMKQIICMYRPVIDRKLSAMISGCRGLRRVEYQDIEDAKKKIDYLLKIK